MNDKCYDHCVCQSKTPNWNRERHERRERKTVRVFASFAFFAVSNPFPLGHWHRISEAALLGTAITRQIARRFPATRQIPWHLPGLHGFRELYRIPPMFATVIYPLGRGRRSEVRGRRSEVRGRNVRLCSLNERQKGRGVGDDAVGTSDFAKASAAAKASAVVKTMSDRMGDRTTPPGRAYDAALLRHPNVRLCSPMFA